MNKKDVLGARPDAGNVQKNGKYAPVGAVPELLKIRHSTWRERREVLAGSGI